ncbi:hypothetical protein [Photobacterium leiognathi]
MLMNNDTLRIQYSPLSKWGASVNKPEFTGTNLVGVNKGHSFLVAKSHGSTLKKLFDCGLVEVDNDTPLPDSRALFFKFSNRADVNRRQIFRSLFLEGRTRVIMEELQTLASSYGLKLIHESLYGLFKVVNEDGTKICKHDLVLENPSNGDPVRKQTDLTMLEWDDIFYSFYQKTKRGKERAAMIKENNLELDI